MKKLFAIVLLVPLLLMPVSCRHNINTSNPRVIFANTLLAAADAVDEVATTLVATNDVIEGLQSTEPDYYKKVKPILVNVAKTNDKAISAIRAAKAGDTSVDWRSAVVAVSSSIGNDDLINFGFKNPNSQAKVKIALASLQMALAVISNSFGGK